MKRRLRIGKQKIKSQMHISQRQEKFSDAYLAAIAAVAGCALAKPNVDDDSVDWTLSAKVDPSSRLRSPKLDIQLKCTGQDDGIGVNLSHSLKKKNYDDLSVDNILVPRILIVVTTPANLADWTSISDTYLILRKRAYWMSLRGMPAIATDSKTVHIPRTNLFTPDSLREIMARIADGSLP